VAAAEVNSVASRRFRDLFNALPADIQKLAVKNYYLWSGSARTQCESAAGFMTVALRKAEHPARRAFVCR
jgi:hypothetical protein